MGDDLESIVVTALGEASVLFMSQGTTPSNELEMPTEELEALAKRLCVAIETLFALS